jgi:uncharacterized protein (TIGR03435 family)
MKLLRGALLTIMAVPVFGQTPATARPEFEVASVKASAPAAAGQVRIGVQIDGAMVHCSSLSLKDYIRMAYKVKDFQILGPDWIGAERFDISAKLPAGAARSQVTDMIQSLLVDRFKLKEHRETRELPVYALIVGKSGPKLKESPLDPEADGVPAGSTPVNVAVNAGRGGTDVSLGRGSSMSFTANRFEAKKLTMAGLADTLARFEDGPVVDMTGLTGTYDFTLEFSFDELRALVRASGTGRTIPPEAGPPPGTDSGVSILTSLQALGLRLEKRKAPLEVVVVDRVEKVPTEN